ncbi:MAG TPA: aminotransferase class V-fold PLP-dependent enzyme [Nitrolancea sp.]|nr:aminotransferase class V-fold PLP-dependent enzyme [Nitrolancea sp.]
MATTETQAKSDMIREQIPAVLKHVYLNTGTFGPLPTATVDAVVAQLRYELEEGRIVHDNYVRGGEIRTEARAEFAKFFDCEPQNVVLTRHTTDGMNIAVNGINWQPGDEIVLSDMEHPGGQAPVYNVARRYGVVVRTARIGDGTGDVVGTFERLINPRTRMLLTSHLTWNTGTVLPLADIVEMAHRHHVLVVADAAQSLGSLPLDVVGMGVDVYGGPGQKWLCGPEGTGATYVSDEAIEQINQTFVGYMSNGALEHAGGHFTPRHGADRYEVGGTFTPAILGNVTSLRFIRETVGLEWAHQRIAQLGQYCWNKLAEIDGVDMITPQDQMAGLISFNLNGYDAPTLTEKLAERGVIIRYIGQPLGARVSTGFYNNEEDIDRLAEGIRDLRLSR